ncbi:hypothetical protein [Bordetella hinzii]|uniref:Phage protein n=1 Tax=Bordetella hinzii OH87 BAL007II TaxID=1331262 RepID=A0ABR4R456_9BORD|nr:hypothetical protein [Bordetella hinzii]KCB25144.1 hypothetical protein L544_1111 [Bordetella hinzii OH87 BAL007II]QDJ43781.1 hypothetical protein CBR70_22130 [Bordetella hinzii]
MTLQVDTSGAIIIDGQDTGLGLSQRKDGSVVYTRERVGVRYMEHTMPHGRYSAAHDAPASGAAGRAQLEADIRALLATQ